MHPGIVMVVSAFRQCIQDDGPAGRLPGSMGSCGDLRSRGGRLHALLLITLTEKVGRPR